MQRCVLDASIALKWFFPHEKKSDLAREILSKIKVKKIEVFVPQIFFFEVINAVKTKVKTTTDDVLEVINKIFSLKIMSKKADKELFKKANFYAQKYDLTIYDASYLALARVLEIDLITADEKLKRKTSLNFIQSLKNYKTAND